MKDLIRVCMLSHSSGLYGAEAAMLELIGALKPHGIACHVLVPRDGPLVSALREREIPHQKVSFHWWVDYNPSRSRRVLKTAWNLSSALLVARAVRSVHADLVYTNTICVIGGAVAAKLLGLPHLWHIHEFGYEDRGLRFDMGDRVAHFLLDALSARLLVNSHAVAEKYARFLPAGKLQVMYQSVTPRAGRAVELPKRAEGVFRCAVVGRLQELKGQHEAIAAAALLADRGILIELWLIGSGNSAYEERLRRSARDAGIAEHVRFTGFVDGAFAYMCAMDAILVCSRIEAFGRMTIEAMLGGKPVIGSRSGGTAELVREGDNGLLYHPGDVVDLADKIQYLSERTEEAVRMGERGRRWAAERFTVDRYGAEAAATIRDMVKRADSKPRRREQEG